MIAYKLLKGTWQNWIIVLKCINISWPLDDKLFYPKEPYSHFYEDKFLIALSLSVSLHQLKLLHNVWNYSSKAHTHTHTHTPVVGKVHRSSTWVKVQIRIIKYYSIKSKSTAFSILLEWKYKSTQFFMYLSKKVLIDRFILQFYIDYFI